MVEQMDKRLFYKSEERISGPWLLDEQTLRKYDELIAKELERLIIVKAQDLHNYINQEIESFRGAPYHSRLTDEERLNEEEKIKRKASGSYDFSQDKKYVTVALQNGKKFQFPAFSDAMANDELSHQKVTEIKAEMRCGLIGCEVSLEQWYNKLLIKASPSDREDASQLFVRLEQWAHAARLPLAARIWANFWGLGTILLLGLFFIITPLAEIKKTDRLLPVKQEAIELIKKGVKPQDQPKALELTLSLLAQYNPAQDTEKKGTEFKKWYRWFLLGLGGFFIILFFPPKTAFGFGKGTRSVSLQKKWVNFVMITIPTLLVGSVIIPIILSSQ